MNKNTKAEDNLRELFQSLDEEKEAPPQLKGEVQAAIRMHHTIGRIARLFTVDMARAAVQMGKGFLPKD